MSNAIDQRIVEMSFENHKFEKGILESSKSLKDFSNVLANTGTGKDFSGLEKSVQTITHSFSMLEQIGIGALRRIGEAALNAGVNLFKGLAIAPITQGFNEMELKMNSTQTIMASTGETLNAVNGYLQDLNEYSDKTIYSFANMTQSIGKFTNAGVKLDTAVMSIKGISNAAALAGANAEEASRAMYNFGQAISSGYVKLIDWKSIELANMATVEFKTQLLEAAVAAGTVTKQANGMYKVLTTDMAGSGMDQTISATRNFNDSLQNQWMTTEVLTGTLSKYADETTDIGRRASKAATQVTTLTKLMSTLKESVGSGWSQSFELIFGDFDEARDLWSGMNDTLGKSIGAMADMRNALLSGGLSTGWKQFMKEGISDTAAFGEMLTTVARESGVDIDKMIEKTGSMEKAIREKIDVADLSPLEQRVANLNERRWVTGTMLTETVDRMSKSIENLSVKELLNIGYTEKTRDELLALRDALKSGKISADEFAKKMAGMSGRENVMAGLKNSVVALLTALRPVSKAFDQIFPRTTAEGLFKLTEVFKNFTQSLILSEETANKVQRTFAGVFAVIDLGWQTVKLLGGALYEVVGIFIPLSGNLLDMTASLGDFLVLLNNTVKNSQVFQYALLGIKIAAVVVRDTLSTVANKVRDFIGVLMTTKRPLEYIGLTLKNLFAGSIGSLQTMVSWVSTKLLKAFSVVQKFLGSKFEFGDESSIGGILTVIKDFVTFLMGGATDTLTDFGKSLINLDFSRIATFVTGGILLMFVNQLTNLTGAMANLTNSANGFVTKFSKKLFASQTKFKDFAIGIGIISASLYMLAQVPFDDLKTGLAGLAGAMLIFVGAYGAIQAITVAASKKMNGTDTIKTAFSLTALAGGLAVMAAAIYTISKIDKERVWASVGVVTAMMGLLVAYQALSVAISLIPGTRAANLKVAGMTAGLFGIVGIIVVLNSLPPGAIASGLIKLAGAMLVIAGIQALFAVASRISKGHKLSVNLLGMTAGVLSLVALMKVLSLLDSSEITKGIKNLLMVGGVLSAMQLMFSLASRVSGGVKAKTNVFAMQMGLVSLITLAVIAGKVNQKNLQNGIKNIAKMAGIVAGLEILTALAARIGSGHHLQKILGSVTLTLSAFTMIIGVLSIYKEATIDKGLKTILKMTGIIVALQAMTAIIGSIKGAVIGIGTMVGLSAMILTITASLALLGALDQDAISRAANSLSVAVVSIGIMAVGIGGMMMAFKTMSISTLTLPKIFKSLVPAFGILGSLLVGTLAFLAIVRMATPMLEGISWDALAKFTVGLGVIGGLAAGFSALANVPGFAAGAKGLNLLPGLVAMGVIVAATGALFALITPVLKELDNVSWDSLGKLTAGLVVLGVLATGISLLTVPLSALAVGWKAVLGGVLVALAGVAMVIFGFIGLAASLEALFGDDPDFLVRSIDKMVLIAEGIGRFFGAIKGGFNAEDMIGYGKGLSGFATVVGEIKTGAFDGVESLAKAMLLLTSSALIDGLARFISSGDNPGEVFAEKVKGLVDGLKKISVKNAGLATDVLTTLTPMAKNLTTFADAAKDIPYSGGFLDSFLGAKDAGEFGKQINKFVEELFAISLITAKHATDVLALLGPFADELKDIGKAASNIPEAGGFMDDFLGSNTVDLFGTQLVAFVGIFSALDVKKDIDPAIASLTAMTPMIDTLKEFASTAGSIGTMGGAFTSIIGDNDIATFGSELKNLITTFGKLDGNLVAQAAANMITMNASFLPGLGKFISLFNTLEATGGEVQDWNGQSSFVNLAKEIKTFVKELKGVDVTVVKPALDALVQINDSFKIVGQDIVNSAIISIQNNKIPFQVTIISLLTGAVKTINLSRNIVSNAIVSIFDKAVKDSGKYVKEFETLGRNLAEGLQNGIRGGQSIANNAAINMAEGVIGKTKATFDINSPSLKFAEMGGQLPAGLAVGINDGKKVAVVASTAMADDVTVAAQANLGDMTIFGMKIPDEIRTGIMTTVGKLKETAEKTGLDTGNMFTTGFASASGTTEGAGTKWLNGMLESLTGSKGIFGDAAKKVSDAVSTGAVAGVGDSKITDKVKGVAKDAFQIFKEGIDKKREYNLMSAWEEIQAWEGFTKKYKAGTEVRMKADKLVAQLRYEYSKTWIDQEKYYKRMSLEQELQAWERVQARYKYGHEYRMQAEREIFRLKEEIWQAEYQNSMANIDEEKYYGRLNLTDELKEWKRILDTTKDGSDERKKVAREIFRLENDIQDQTLAYEESLVDLDQERADKRARLDEEYYAKTEELNRKMTQDIKTLTDEYDNALKSRTNALYSAWGIFDKVEMPRIDGRELLRNLEGQVVAFDQWQAHITRLSQKGISEGLLAELTAMGPSAGNKIAALNALSDEELAKYVELWTEKSQDAKTQATSELEDLKDANAVKIQEITEQTEEELSYYTTVWKDSLQEVDDDSRVKLDSIEKTWVSSIGSMTSTGISTIQKFRLEWFGEIQQMVTDTNTQMSNLQTATAGTMSAKMAQAASTIGPVINTALSKSIRTNTVGTQIVNGVVAGIQQTAPKVYSVTSNLGAGISKTLNTALRIQSPSKETMETGKFIVLGLVDGMKQFAGAATTTTQGIGQTIMAALGSSVNGVSDLLGVDNDDTFTITPILDLTNVRAGMAEIASLFRSNATPTMATAGIDLAPAKSQTVQVVEVRSKDGVTTNQAPNEIQIINHFSVRNDNDIRKISDDLKKTMDRFNNAKGVAVT